MATLVENNYSAKINFFTIGVLSVVTLPALALKDVGFVVSISGAMFGCLLIFIVSALSNIKVRPLSPLSCPSEGGRQSGRNALYSPADFLCPIL